MRRGWDPSTVIALLAVVATTVGCTAAPTTTSLPSVGASPLASTPASLVATPTGSALPEAEGWRVVASWPGRVTSVVETPFGWFALGSTADAPRDAVLWTSADGTAWAESDETALRQADSLWAVGPGLIAVGNTATIDFGTPLLWSSPDGVSWSPVHFMADPDNAAVTSVIEWRGRLIAMGVGGPSDVPASDGGAVWTSTDGLDWQSQGIGGEYVATALEFDGRLFQAGGAGGPRLVGPPAEPRRAAIWTSTDGVAFEPQAASPTLAGARIQGASVADGSLVLIGSYWDDETSQGEPAIWASTDGVTWSERLHAACCGSVEGTARLGEVMLAAASDDATGRVIIYRSSDLETWEADGMLPDIAGTPRGFVSTTLGPLLLVESADESHLLSWQAP